MTLGARDDLGWANQLPEEPRVGALGDAVPFDSLVTPADPDVACWPRSSGADPARSSATTLMGDEVHPVGWLRLSLRMFPGPITTVPVHRSTAAFSNPARCSDSELAETLSPSSTSRRTSFHLHSNDEFRHRLVSTAGGP
jgi:hypothetical protein